MSAAGGAIGALAWGSVLALVYLGGLAWTVRLVRGSGHPLVVVVASYLVRAAMVAGGLLLIAQGDGPRLLLACGGFLLARAVVLWRVRARHHHGAGHPGV